MTTFLAEKPLMLSTSNHLAQTISYMKLILRGALCTVFVALAACDKGPPSTPSPPPLNLTGTWRGNITVAGTPPSQMMWTLTQTNQAVNGPVIVLLPTGTVLLNGVLSGTPAGTVLTYAITVPVGGIPLAPTCSGQIGGTATATNPSTLNGTYTVTSSTCPIGLTTGTFILAKQ